MKYATWKLVFNDSDYGTGPEDTAAKAGFKVFGGVLKGSPTEGTILGYFEGEPSGLEEWDFQEVTADYALAFVKELNDTAWFLEDGTIATINPSLGE